MKKIINIIVIILLTSCGFKVVKQFGLNEYYITEINFFGDKKVNYLIKNNLLNLSKDNQKKPIVLDLTTSKIKTIKEKNIKNEITKYQIKIEAKVKIKEMGTHKHQLFISETGEYNVNSQHSQTISNEKKLLDILASNLSDNLILALADKLNDI